MPYTARLTLLRTESARPSRHAKLESKRARQRTRTRVHTRVRCGASGHSQPQRNLPKALRMNTAAHTVHFVDPNRVCTMSPAPVRRSRRRFSTQDPTPCPRAQLYISASAASAFVDLAAVSGAHPTPAHRASVASAFVDLNRVCTEFAQDVSVGRSPNPATNRVCASTAAGQAGIETRPPADTRACPRSGQMRSLGP